MRRTQHNIDGKQRRSFVAQSKPAREPKTRLPQAHEANWLLNFKDHPGIAFLLAMSLAVQVANAQSATNNSSKKASAPTKLALTMPTGNLTCPNVVYPNLAGDTQCLFQTAPTSLPILDKSFLKRLFPAKLTNDQTASKRALITCLSDAIGNDKFTRTYITRVFQNFKIKFKFQSQEQVAQLPSYTPPIGVASLAAYDIQTNTIIFGNDFYQQMADTSSDSKKLSWLRHECWHAYQHVINNILYPNAHELLKISPYHNDQELAAYNAAYEQDMQSIEQLRIRLYEQKPLQNKAQQWLYDQLHNFPLHRHKLLFTAAQLKQNPETKQLLDSTAPGRLLEVNYHQEKILAVKPQANGDYLVVTEMQSPVLGALRLIEEVMTDVEAHYGTYLPPVKTYERDAELVGRLGGWMEILFKNVANYHAKRAERAFPKEPQTSHSLKIN